MRSKAISFALRFGVSALLIAWLAARVDLRAVAAEIGAVGVETVLAVLGLQAANTLLKSYKWQRLLAADGIQVSQASAFATYMVGTFFNLFLPTSIGGDAVRVVDAGRRSGRRVATATSVVADRVLGFGAIGAIGLAALAGGSAAALRPRLRIGAALLYVGVLAASGLAFAGWPLWFLRVFRLERFERLERAVRSVADSLAAYRKSGRLVELLLISIAAQIIMVVAVALIGRSLAIEAGLSYFFVIVPLVGLIESIPVSIYGIGLRDVSYVYLLGLAGTQRAPALSLSVLYVLLTLLYALLGGVIFALRRPPAPVAGTARETRS